MTKHNQQAAQSDDQPANNSQPDSQLHDLQQQLQQKDEAHKRALADYQNLQRQMTQERQRLREQAAANVITNLLPTLDNLQRAQEHIKDQSLQMIIDDLWRTLSQHGLTAIEITAGKTPFDHLTMEAVDAQPGPDQIVLAVQQAGYTLNGFVLRHAQVIVGQGEK